MYNTIDLSAHHSRLLYPHMFEVHTAERIFVLSAPSEDEMQSWVGMLQTLQHHNRTRPPERKAASLKEPPLRTVQETSEDSSVRQR